jgi:hypothetical protein
VEIKKHKGGEEAAEAEKQVYPLGNPSMWQNPVFRNFLPVFFFFLAEF